MAITFACPCGRAIDLPDHLAGRRVACPSCSRPLAVPAAPDDDGGAYAMTAAPPDPFPPQAGEEFREPAVRETVRKALAEMEEEKEREWLRHHGGSHYNNPMIEGMAAAFAGCLFLFLGTIFSPCSYVGWPLLLGGAGRYWYGRKELHAQD